MDIDYFLIKRMFQGDESAFDLFVRKYYKDILRYCMYHCFDQETAKDLAQDTFLHFFKSLDRYTHKGKVKNYLYTIAGNVCKNYFKKKREKCLDLSKAILVVEDPTEDSIDRIGLNTALDNLSEEFREVIILYYYQNLKQHDIARILGIGLPLVKYRLKRAKEELKKLLLEE